MRRGRRRRRRWWRWWMMRMVMVVAMMMMMVWMMWMCTHRRGSGGRVRPRRLRQPSLVLVVVARDEDGWALKVDGERRGLTCHAEGLRRGGVAAACRDEHRRRQHTSVRHAAA
jgi:hypothetical protein